MCTRLSIHRDCWQCHYISEQRNVPLSWHLWQHCCPGKIVICCTFQAIVVWFWICSRRFVKYFGQEYICPTNIFSLLIVDLMVDISVSMIIFVVAIVVPVTSISVVSAIYTTSIPPSTPTSVKWFFKTVISNSEPTFLFRVTFPTTKSQSMSVCRAFGFLLIPGNLGGGTSAKCAAEIRVRVSVELEVSVSGLLYILFLRSASGFKIAQIES